jgi:hypothetical protein
MPLLAAALQPAFDHPKAVGAPEALTVDKHEGRSKDAAMDGGVGSRFSRSLIAGS